MMGDIPMPGGWSMSAVWTPMCGQTWLQAATAFVGMWTWMMAAMTLPLSTLEWRGMWRGVPGRGRSQRLPPVPCFPRFSALPLSAAACSVLLSCTSGLPIWAAAGSVVFVLGNALAVTLPHMPALAHCMPLLSSLLVIIAGAVQFTPWKARRIARCEYGDTCAFRAGTALGTACKRGLRTALQEGYCCANLMAVLLVIGVMDLDAMVGITAAMCLERLAPAERHAAHGIGVVVVGIGLSMSTRAALAL